MNLRGFVAAIGLFGFVLLAVVMGGFAVSASANDVQPITRTVENESIQVDYNNSVTVRQAGADALLDNETVRNATGDQLVEGTDYTYDTSTGEVTWSNTTNTSAGSLARIRYRYQGQPVPTRVMMGFAPTLVGGLVYLALAFVPIGIIALFVYVGVGFAGGTPRARGGGR